MIRAAVLSPWVEYDPNDPLSENHPQLADDHPVHKWKDITGQPAENIPTDPNLVEIEVTCTPKVLNEIEADDTYYVLWYEDK